jgi:hypothetical protein
MLNVQTGNGAWKGGRPAYFFTPFIRIITSIMRGT